MWMESIRPRTVFEFLVKQSAGMFVKLQIGVGLVTNRFQGLAHNPKQGVNRKWLRQESKTSSRYEALHQVGVVEPGDKQDTQIGFLRAETLRQHGAGQIGHDDIG